jgi:hypothetical protein
MKLTDTDALASLNVEVDILENQRSIWRVAGTQVFHPKGSAGRPICRGLPTLCWFWFLLNFYIGIDALQAAKL